MSGNKKVTITTIPSDAHTWNLVYIQLFLEEYGFLAQNIGSCPPYDLTIRKCCEHQPDLIVVSTVNGHGYIEGLELVKRIKQSDFVNNVPVIIGGKLTTKGRLTREEKENLLKEGYSEVFEGNSAIGDFPEYLEIINGVLNKRTA